MSFHISQVTLKEFIVSAYLHAVTYSFRAPVDHPVPVSDDRYHWHTQSQLKKPRHCAERAQKVHWSSKHDDTVVPFLFFQHVEWLCKSKITHSVKIEKVEPCWNLNNFSWRLSNMPFELLGIHKDPLLIIWKGYRALYQLRSAAWFDGDW